MLGELSTEGHCALCDITFELELDRAIEAVFVPHPSVRAVSERPFCTGGPARTPHVVEQRVLTPGGTKAFPVPHETARFRVFVRGGARASVEADPSGPREVRLAFDGSAIEPCAVTVAPGGAVLLENRAPTPTHAKLERLAYATHAATASRVATLPEFREQFSADLLKRSTPLKVSRVALLFSDLTGSTALYSSLGDAAAFRIVDDHFDVLRSVVEKHGGAVVKTMGDAVMAAFENGAACARASLAALDAFEDFRTSRPHAERVGLKLGMHEGACYVVTANRALDYFGQAVNVASRLQHLACAGELVLHADEHAALGDEVLGGTVVVERFDAHVKGIDAPLPVVRVRPRSVFAPDTLRSRIQDVTIRSA
jgi:class 3 adenylate cyclase